MFGVEDLRKTRFAQELKLEGKLEAIPQLLKRQFSARDIAEILQLDIQQVEQAIANLN